MRNAARMTAPCRSENSSQHMFHPKSNTKAVRTERGVAIGCRFTHKWFIPSMCSCVNVEMSLLGETFATVW